MKSFNKISIFKQNKCDNYKEDEILQSIRLVKVELDLIRNSFEYLNDSKLIDMAIYQEQAAISKFEYLIGEAKKNGIKIEEKEIYFKACE